MRPNWFLALPVPAGAWLAPLLADVPPGIHAFHPADLHITLAFLGPCSPEAARAAWDALADQESPPIAATLGRLAPMGNRRQPSAFSALLAQGELEAAALIGEWRALAFQAAQVKPEDRPPLPHVTVARPPRRAAPALRAAGLEWARSKPDIGAAVALDRLALYTWSPDRGARLFVTTAERPLTPARSTCGEAGCPGHNQEWERCTTWGF